MGKRISHVTTRAAQPARDLNHAERLANAIRMRKEGHEWQTIADMLGIRGGKGAAYNMVNDALKKEKREGLRELRELETGRLDALWAVYYPKALGGDGWSFDRCLRLSERRAALLGLDAPKVAADTSAPGAIVREYPPEWIALLKLGNPAAPAVEPAPAEPQEAM